MRSLRENVLRTRWLQLADKLKENDLGGLLVTNPSDVRWLTGYSGSNGAALALADSPPLLATDARYTEQATHECPEAELIITRDLITQLLMRLRENTVTTLAVDPASISLAQFRMLSAHPAMFGVALKEIDEPLVNLRREKDLLELEATTEACTITVAAFDELLNHISVGKSEKELARYLEYLMSQKGADDRSFDTIVAAGANGGQPHHSPGEYRLQAGDLVTFDFGALLAGYHADFTRTVIVGANAKDWQIEIYDLVAAAAQAGRDAAGPAVPAAVVDAAARDVIVAGGFGEFFAHGLGHGVGLDIHESPWLNSSSTDTLSTSVPFTVEPGIYLPNRGGVRIEDTCVLRADGLHILTEFSRELLRVD